MLKIRWISLSVVLLVSVNGSPPPLFASEVESGQTPIALTTADQEIPVDELELMLNPLTKDELLVEAIAWQVLLKEKATEIAKAEIAVKRQNQEIKKAEEIHEQIEDVRDQLGELEQKAKEAKASGDVEKILETQGAAEDVYTQMQILDATVEEAAEAAEKTAEIRSQMTEETQDGLSETADAAGAAQKALGRVQDIAQTVNLDDANSVRAAVGEAKDATREATQATEVATEKVGKVAESAVRGELERTKTGDAVVAIEQAELAKKDDKVKLLETVNRLREERIIIIDRLEAVLDELGTKTDVEDTGTQAQLRDFRLYIRAVSGINLDVKDTTSAWVAIKGWIVSDEGGLRWARNLGTFLGILLGAWFLSKLLSRIVHRALGMTDKVSQLLEDFLVGAVRWIAMIVGVLMALASLEISVGPLLAVVGAAGFVIALALQDSLSNFASGIMILFFRPFDVGDVVEAGGVSGSVTSMNLVATSINTFDNKQMVVPNNKVWRDVITNATGVATRRVDMEFGIGYDDDIDRAHAILEEVVKAHPRVLADPVPAIRVHALADSSVNFICRPWTRTEDYWSVYWDVTKEVKKCFDAAGIGIPYPQRDVHLYLEDVPVNKSLWDLVGGKKENQDVPLG